MVISVEKIKRQKIEERQHLDYTEKLKISKKSDERCCHCGKKVYFEFEGTLEHFVPISKGGTNRDVNLYMLCKDCNKKKGNFIYSPSDYMLYLKDEYKEKLDKYFESYINSFEFVNKNNILACDRYKVGLVNTTQDKARHLKKKNKRKIYEKITTEYWIKRAEEDDRDRIIDFLKAVCDKRLEEKTDRSVIADIVDFFLEYGCIYYQDFSGEIKTVSIITVQQSEEDGVGQFLSVNNFVLYKNERTLSVLLNFVWDLLPYIVMDEQKLPSLPVATLFPFTNVPPKAAIYAPKESLVMPGEDEKVKAFFNKFEITETKEYEDLISNLDNMELLIAFFTRVK